MHIRRAVKRFHLLSHLSLSCSHLFQRPFTDVPDLTQSLSCTSCGQTWGLGGLPSWCFHEFPSPWCCGLALEHGALTFPVVPFAVILCWVQCCVCQAELSHITWDVRVLSVTVVRLMLTSNFSSHSSPACSDLSRVMSIHLRLRINRTVHLDTPATVSDSYRKKEHKSMEVSVIELKPLCTAPEEGIAVKCQLDKALQRASVCTTSVALTWSQSTERQKTHFKVLRQPDEETETQVHQLLPTGSPRDLVIEEAVGFRFWRLQCFDEERVISFLWSFQVL